MKKPVNDLAYFSDGYKNKYRAQKMILSFQQFLDIVKKNPYLHTRNSSAYIYDTINYFKSIRVMDNIASNITRHCVFDLDTDAGGPVVSNEYVQKDIFDTIRSFKDKDYNDKLILIHGPNGSGKTSTVEKITKGMEIYSGTEEGAVYCFNWVFPQKLPNNLNNNYGQKDPIGFYNTFSNKYEETYAFCEEHDIQTKIYSSFRENPLFLLPNDMRIRLLQAWISEKNSINLNEVHIPKHLQKEGLSKKNQQIFAALTSAYNGDILKVFAHIQVERFFFSQKYQVGISTVNPQITIDAYEKQITLDRNYSNLPAVLQNINFYELSGELITANRGLLEFSDLLKRPIDSFKYLLSTIETGHIKLFSGLESVDTVYIATTNDKHLDVLKSTIEFNSFQGRFEFISLPYLRKPSQEIKIYQYDIDWIKKTKNICPHVFDLLCLWAVLTRVKKPDIKEYLQEEQEIISRLDPLSKIKLYENKGLCAKFDKKTQVLLKKLTAKIWHESSGSMLYEGRFGFSPRNMRSLIYKLLQVNTTKSISVQDLFLILEKLIKETSLHEFLRIEPVDHYYNPKIFIEYLKDSFYYTFKEEITLAVLGNSEQEYNIYLKNYIEHAICFSKKEKIIDSASKQFIEPSEELMQNVESILGVKTKVTEHRSGLLAKVAAYKLENSQDKIDLCDVFSEYLKAIKNYFYEEQKNIIMQEVKKMIDYYNNDCINNKEYKNSIAIYERMCLRFGYTIETTYTSLDFFLKYKPKHEVFINCKN